MGSGNGTARPTGAEQVVHVHEEQVTRLHPAWRAFVRFCQDVQHGEIERLKIQDGLPVLAEVTRKKVKFAP